jgi:hypothetical protein
MTIQNLTIPYPDFKFDEIINPEAFDLNNDAIKVKTNEIVTKVNDLDTNKLFNAQAERKFTTQICSYNITGNNVANSYQVYFAFPEAFNSPPIVMPGNVLNTVSYSDVMYYPFITGVTENGFYMKVTASGNFGAGTLSIRVLAFGI